MYVYGPSSLANYPASVWEHRTFSSQPSVSECGERRWQLTFLDIPGKVLFSLGGSWDSSLKVSHWVTECVEPYSCFGNWMLVYCMYVCVCICACVCVDGGWGVLTHVGVHECCVGAVSWNSISVNFVNLMFPTHSCFHHYGIIGYVDNSLLSILMCA